MVRNLKVLGLAVMAMLAMTAVAASAAQAVEFHSEIENTTITAKTEAGSNSVFDAAGASISCTSGTFTGTQAAKTAETVTVTPAYSGCTFLGILNVPVEMHGCQYTFHANGETDVTGASCTGITFEATGCKVEVKKQNGLKEVTYTNIGAGTTREVTVTPHVTGITYTSSGLCPKNGTFSDGNYTSGNATVKGESSKGVQAGVWVE
jgi:opacity protein-like surface antigen